MATKSKLPFKTILDENERFYTASGEKVEPVLAMKLNDKGEEEFYVEGYRNVYDEIQSYAADSTIEAIISKVMATGDISILNRKKGEFMDLTEMPENIFEAQQRIQQAEKTFEQLPLEIKKAYNFNFNEYLADVGSDKWLEITGLKEKPLEPVPEPEKGEKTE